MNLEEIKAKINTQYADTIGTESHERKWLCDLIESLRQQLEIERMRNVACDVVAMADTPTSAEEARKMLPDYRSAALESVIRRVDECIALRQQLAEKEYQRQELMRAFERQGNSAQEVITELRQQLAAALAACKVKDRALLIATDYADYYDPEYPFIAGKEALTIQPDDSALQTFAEKVREQCARIIEAQDVDPSFKHRMAYAIRTRGNRK